MHGVIPVVANLRMRRNAERYTSSIPLQSEVFQDSTDRNEQTFRNLYLLISRLVLLRMFDIHPCLASMLAPTNKIIYFCLRAAN